MGCTEMTIVTKTASKGQTQEMTHLMEPFQVHELAKELGQEY